MSSLVDEVASMFILGMQSLPMPWRASANATGLFVWPGEGVQNRCDQSTLTCFFVYIFLFVGCLGLYKPGQIAFPSA